MIITLLMGGLGNQMFQYATARRLAYIRNTPLKLDVSYYSHNQEQDQERSYGLSCFDIQAEIATAEEIDSVKETAYFKEKGARFDLDVLNLGSTDYLEGFWQSEKYFSDVPEIIRKDFTLFSRFNKPNRLIAQEISSSEAVALHIRRADYVTDPRASQFHGACSLDYYYRAIERVKCHCSHPHIFVFSDDWEWAEANLKPACPVTFVTVNGPDDCHEDLRLMSLCKYHIIANSTFSWWGAWLAGYHARMVIAPLQWYRVKDYQNEDLIPAHWLSL